jgi:hypothetical protein
MRFRPRASQPSAIRALADLVLPATITLRPSAAKRLHNWAPSPRSGPTPTTIAVFMALASHAPKIAFSRHLAHTRQSILLGDRRSLRRGARAWRESGFWGCCGGSSRDRRGTFIGWGKRRGASTPQSVSWQGGGRW